MRDARCRFCGEPAVVGGIDHLALTLPERCMTHECLACSQEFNRYTMRVLKRMPDGLPRQEQLEAIRQLREQATRHMQQWISKRQSQ
jgi:hypothetical protein